MSGERISQENFVKLKNTQKVYKSKVDINVLLNKVRTEQKKERKESFIFISLISFAVIITGIIVSF